MRLVIQRVSSAAVQVGGETVGAIGRGLLVLVGVEQGDEPPAALAAAEKLASLRVFDDAAGKMNLDAAAGGAAFLVVSQFTLAASPPPRPPPSFDPPPPPEHAAPPGAAPLPRLR